jgi:serine/threonine-protein kinase
MKESEGDGLSTAADAAERQPTSGPGPDPVAGQEATAAADWSTDPGTETDRDPLLMLLLRWEEAVARGEDPDPRILCGDDTLLMAALGERIVKRKRLRALLALPEMPRNDRDDPPLPEFPGHEVLGRLGRGGMGIVYRARDVRLGRIVALKTLAEARYATREQIERFLDEARAVARLRHPNIVGIHAIGEHDGQPYLSLEYVEGGNLAHRLVDGPMAPRPAAELVETLARAIDAAHRAGVVHRDLKPANVLLTVDGAPKVGDFGLAKLMDSDSALTCSGQVIGTPSFMAPEQAEGHSGRVGPPADIYAMGAILYQTLTGRPPFLGESALETIKLVATTDAVPPTRLRPGVPRDLETICLKCLEKDPARRYATSAALADDLRRFLDGRPIAARPVGAAGRSLRWARRNRTLAAVSTVLAAVFALGAPGFFALWLAARSDRARADRERQNAVAALGATQQARAQAEDARRRAEAARERALSAIRNILFTEGNELATEEARPYRQALTAMGLREAEGLVRALEGDPQSEIQFVIGHMALLGVQLDAGQVQAAEETGRKALALAEALDARLDSTESRELLAMTLHRLTILPGSNERTRARARRSNAIYEALAARRPDGPITAAHSVSLNDYNIGHTCFLDKDLAGAASAFESAIRVCEEAMRRGDQDRPIRLDLARALVYLGRVRIHTGRMADAVEPIRRAIAIYQALVDQPPPDFSYTQLLSLAYDELGFAYMGLGRPDDRIACHEAARAALKAAAERHRGVVSRVAQIQARIAVVDFNLTGAYESDLARYHDRSRAIYAEAYEICDKLELVEPLSDDLKLVLVFALSARVDSRIEDGKEPDLEDYARAERLLEELRVRQAWNVTPRAMLVIIRHEWADELEARGGAADARACRDRAASGARGDGAALFEAAVSAADTARWAGTYPTRIDARQVRARRQRLLRRAVRLIEQAIDEGFRDAPRLHREATLRILADAPEFRAVADSLDDRVFPADPFAPRP